ncbi:WD repeat-containing protein 55 homolog [Halyomorpha halys]|uniref:WD repeat-containing protein 55 homolog n=1 Tax=Halyomorpha halys TaxID=286706 RepID=UPI0006D4DDB0|nr:WD repeat-containing protein 55 homolog [Halyomorpha halys]
MYLSDLQFVEGDPVDSDLADSDDSMSESEDDTDSDESIDSSELEENGTDENSSTENANNDEDLLISAIEERRNNIQNKLSPIKSDDLFIDLSFHPSMDLITVSCLSGNIEVYEYAIEENTLKGTIEAHTKACRAVEFSEDGTTIYSVGKDKNIVISDLETFDMKMYIDNAHHVALTTIISPDENIISTGDEEGVIKIWDTRFSQTPTMKFHDLQDYVSCITSKDSYKIACTSGDGTLTSYDLRTKKRLQQSAPFEADLTCCSSTHSDTMIVCGTMTGQFLFYKWSDFSDLAGTYKPPKKCSINSVLEVSDNIILSGMEDGQLRAFHFFPHKEIGIVGQHTLIIENLDISHDGKIVASLSPDPIIKFWDISYLEGFLVSEVERNRGHESKNLPSSEFDDRKSFFSDLS